MDLYSHKIVSWEVYERERAEHASVLMRNTVLSEHCITRPQVLHSDNGSVLKTSTLMVTLDALGIEASYSRPRVSNDNACSESLFRKCKYRPDYPAGGFVTIDAARDWIARFVQWYHHAHRHRSLRYITPAQRHAGLDGESSRNATSCISRQRPHIPSDGPGRHGAGKPSATSGLTSAPARLQNLRSLKGCMTKHDDYLDTHRRERTLACGQVGSWSAERRHA